LKRWNECHEPGERSYDRSFPQTYASADRAARLSRWLTQDGRFLAGNRELLDQFCAGVIEAGVPLSRAWLHIRTLHPEFAGVSRVWRRGIQTEERFLDFGFEAWPAYVNSPVRHVVEQRKLCRWRLDGAEPLPFPFLEEHRAAGYVDYAIAPMVFFGWEGQCDLMGYGPSRWLRRRGSTAIRRNTPNVFDDRGGEESPQVCHQCAVYLCGTRAWRTDHEGPDSPWRCTHP